MVIEKINKEGHNAAFNPVTIHCAKHGMENRRFELGPPGESKLPLSNRKYTDFFENSHNKNFYYLQLLLIGPSWILGPLHPPMMETIRPAGISG